VDEYYDMRGPFNPKEAWEWFCRAWKIIALIVGATWVVATNFTQITMSNDANIMKGKQQQYFGTLISTFEVKLQSLKEEQNYMRNHVEQNGKDISEIKGILKQMSRPVKVAGP